MVVALVHAFVVAHSYSVGSFDDDSNYILTARAFLDGQGLTGHLVSGTSVVSAYPPGFPILLAPIEWLSGASYVPLQLLSAACYAAVFPLLWLYLKRRGLPDAVCIGTMVLMALNPVMATFGAMVMAEMPYLVCFLLLLLALDRWDATQRVMTPVGLLAVALAAETVWLKEAGLGLVLGIVLWFVLRGRFAKAVAVVGGLGLSLVPVAVARMATGVPLAGGRYSSQLGAYYGGNLLDRLVQVVPSAAWHWLTVALPRSIAPFGSPFPQTGAWEGVFSVVICQATVFTVVGFVVAVRRHRDVAVVAVPVYVLETVLWPQVNERRVILALPVLLAWYALGVHQTVTAASTWLRDRTWSDLPVSASFSVLGVLLLLVPLTLQFPRDYLFGLGQSSSRPSGSRYMAILRALTPHNVPVETTYLYTTALFSGHLTAETAVDQAVAGANCTSADALQGISKDHAGFLLVGALNKPDVTDSRCLLYLAAQEPWAVRLLRTARDQASVFELIGPGTAHPDLTDVTAGPPNSASAGLGFVPARPIGGGDEAGIEPVTAAAGGTVTPAGDLVPSGAATSSEISVPPVGAGTFTWSLGSNRELTQVSVGEAGQLNGLAGGVQLQIQLPDGTWETVASAAHAVGDGSHHAPFLLAHLAPNTYASGVRVVVRGTGTVFALDVAALALGGDG